MITISFNCENHNNVLLLTTLFDILTVEHVEDSIAMMDCAGWLLDEVVRRLEEIAETDEEELGGFALEVIKLERNRRSKLHPPLPKENQA